jgi:hypothetical protein
MNWKLWKIFLHNMSDISLFDSPKPGEIRKQTKQEPQITYDKKKEEEE